MNAEHLAKTNNKTDKQDCSAVSDGNRVIIIYNDGNDLWKGQGFIMDRKSKDVTGDVHLYHFFTFIPSVQMYDNDETDGVKQAALYITFDSQQMIQ